MIIQKMKRIVNRNFKISLNFLGNSQKNDEFLPFYAKAETKSIKIGIMMPYMRTLATALHTEIGASDKATEGRCASWG